METEVSESMQQLLDALERSGLRFCGVREAMEVSGKTYMATGLLLQRLERSGRLVRLMKGRYAILPEREEKINKLAVGRDLAQGADYYIAYASAMEAWGMPPGEQAAGPVKVVLKDQRWRARRTVLGVDYQFVKHPVLPPRKPGRAGRNKVLPKDWMVREMEVTPGERVKISDPEWTIVSGLGRPDLCGGVKTIAHWMNLHRDALDMERILRYAWLVRNRTAARRLGYLLEVLDMHTPDSELRLSLSVFSSYSRLEPALPPRENWCRRWRLDVNDDFSAEEGG